MSASPLARRGAPAQHYSLAEAEGAHRLAHRVEEIVHQTGLPIAFCVYAEGGEAGSLYPQLHIPVFTEIEDALRGLAASRDRHRWIERHGDIGPKVAISPSPSSRQPADPGLAPLPWTADPALSLCQAYGIPVASWEAAASPNETAQAAERLGYPVALQLLSAQAVHKSDIGGVALGVADAAAVRREAEAMLGRVGPPAALMVQQMVSGGIEEVRGRRLLEGVRGRPPADKEALIQVLLALSRLMTENPQVAEMDINPLLVLPDGALAVDARAVGVPGS